jgi:hypothetical protein
MASEPDWDMWRRIDSAPLWQFVALLAGLDPDSIEPKQDRIEHNEWRGTNEDFHRFLTIAVSSVQAHKLQCQAYGSTPWRNRVLTSEFLRWAQSKEIPIPPEWKPLPEETGDTSAGVVVSTRIEGINGLRVLIKELGLTLGHDAAVRSFAKRAGIMRTGENQQRRRLSWERSEIEPMLIEAIKDRLEKQTK